MSHARNGQSAKSAVENWRPECIVGIGASAGGLEALERFFHSIPADSGMAFVVVQHLSPDFKSLMEELLSRHTPLPVRMVEDGQRVERNAVYLIPPRKEMIVAEGHLLLTDRDHNRGLCQPIDRFFRSLAQDAGKRAVAIILSGTGSDGSRGVVDVHAAGGLVLSQSTVSSRFSAMPLRAQESGAVDLVLAPEEMSAALLRHQEHLRRGSMEPTPAEPDRRDRIAEILDLLKESHGIDFKEYKPHTVLRRIERRVALTDSAGIDQYVTHLHSRPEELDDLYHDLLIGVTQFFRDVDVFRVLEKTLIPQILERCQPDTGFRAWVAGCASGEEAYSLAMLVREALDKFDRPIPVKIFATDIHGKSLEKAAAGVYDEDRLHHVSEERRKRFFQRHPDGYQVTHELRQMIVFAPHNVIKDAPFTRMNLVTCRNLLIYLQPQIQKKIISLFSFGLVANGTLLLGLSESPGPGVDEFEPINEGHRIFRKRDGMRPTVLDGGQIKRPRFERVAAETSPNLPSRTSGERSLLKVYDRLLDRNMPPAILVNARRELVHCFGGAGQYLRYPDGRSSGDVLELLDDEMRTAVTGALSRVALRGEPVCYRHVPIKRTDGETSLRLTVQGIEGATAEEAHFLIALEANGPQPVRTDSEAPDLSEDLDSAAILRERVSNLEAELRYTKEALQTTMEEREAGTEEQQATNEELVASNEELQSTNQELHSVNEELYTVNAEYQRKIAELTQMAGDMDNLFRSADIRTIFLDRELRVRKFTPRVSEVFNLLPQDVGRRIDSFTHGIEYDGLANDLQRVIDSAVTVDTEVTDRLGNWFQLRLLPYRQGQAVEGVVLTLVDITSLKNVEAELRQKEREAREAVAQRDRFLTILSHELRNPLSAISSSVQVIEMDQQMMPRSRTARNVIERQVRQMARLLDDLLDVSRIVQRRIEIQRRPCNILRAVADAAAVVQSQFDARQVTLTFHCADEPVLMLGDMTRIQQMLVNLLSNAAKYTPPLGHVDLHAYREGENAVIRIEDTGMGIPECMLETIFDLFVQSDHSLDRSDGGMGVGLTLVRSIVDLHGGHVAAFSEGPGKGSEFVVRIPALAQVEEDEPEEDASEPIAARRIVVVEDQEANREMLVSLLELAGHQVSAAEDGEAGLELIRKTKPELALIDIGLPKLNGYDLVRTLRNDVEKNGTLLVALTGYGQAGDRARSREAGFDDHLTKPLDGKLLQRVLQRIERKRT